MKEHGGIKAEQGEGVILSFILLNFNNVDYTIPCIASIKRVVKARTIAAV